MERERIAPHQEAEGEEARKELEKGIQEEEAKDPDFWKKHDERIGKEKPGA